jgi:hypothetical protein
VGLSSESHPCNCSSPRLLEEHLPSTSLASSKSEPPLPSYELLFPLHDDLHKRYHELTLQNTHAYDQIKSKFEWYDTDKDGYITCNLDTLLGICGDL